MTKLTRKGTITKGELLKRARRYCLYCCGGQAKEVELCDMYNCAWWDIRFGNCTPLERPKLESPPPLK